MAAASACRGPLEQVSKKLQRGGNHVCRRKEVSRTRYGAVRGRDCLRDRVRAICAESGSYGEHHGKGYRSVGCQRSQRDRDRHGHPALDRVADSDELGRFLQPATASRWHLYLKVEIQGFQTAVENSILLQLNQTARIDFQLKIGAVTQMVEVSGQAPLLHTDTMQVGYVTNALTNIELPLATRNFVQLTLLTPGVVNPNPSTMMSGQRTGGGGRPYVNENRKE